jgi:hypothetical protein
VGRILVLYIPLFQDITILLIRAPSTILSSSVGPVLAYSSRFAGIDMACKALWQHEINTAIADETKVLTNPDNFTGVVLPKET